jgi:hypothetical protein
MHGCSARSTALISHASDGAHLIEVFFLTIVNCRSSSLLMSSRRGRFYRQFSTDFSCWLKSLFAGEYMRAWMFVLTLQLNPAAYLAALSCHTELVGPFPGLIQPKNWKFFPVKIVNRSFLQSSAPAEYFFYQHAAKP